MSETVAIVRADVVDLVALREEAQQVLDMCMRMSEREWNAGGKELCERVCRVLAVAFVIEVRVC